jgi:uncharacterized membrane protein YfcA
MLHLDARLAAAFGAAFLAAAINSVAGGGTLVSFPVLLWLGLPPIVANATSTVGIWPGSLGSVWGFRREFRRTRPVLRWLVLPSVAGGAAGALLLRGTSSAAFERLVPFLILFATVAFTLQARAQAWVRARTAGVHPGGRWLAAAIAAQLAVGIYGGYFGAGMSILMLATLGLLGMTDILEMNALTSFFALWINGIAIAVFLAAGLVDLRVALVMAAGALLGGYGAAGIARRVGRVAVRRFVVAVGFTMTVLLFVRIWL